MTISDTPSTCARRDCSGRCPSRRTLAPFAARTGTYRTVMIFGSRLVVFDNAGGGSYTDPKRYSPVVMCYRRPCLASQRPIETYQRLVRSTKLHQAVSQV